MIKSVPWLAYPAWRLTWMFWLVILARSAQAFGAIGAFSTPYAWGILVPIDILVARPEYLLPGAIPGTIYQPALAEGKLLYQAGRGWLGLSSPKGVAEKQVLWGGRFKV